MMRSYRMLAATVLVSAALSTTACGKKDVVTPAPAMPVISSTSVTTASPSAVPTHIPP